jgi:hypothetical protein
VVPPAQGIREVAARPGLGLTPILEAHGHSELEARAATAYEQWVESGEPSFRRRDDVEQLDDVIKFRWEASFIES